MPIKDMATTTTTMILIRFLGGTIGISVGNVGSNSCFSVHLTVYTQAIYEAGLRQRLPLIQGYNPASAGMTNDLRSLQNIEPTELRERVLHAYTRSLALIWYA